ncbi:hypothetical protein SESBI_45089 [Sesbania bispinosa]|nr:hypothetical protein SESBI_45089 [Sesbania bispinosa]
MPTTLSTEQCSLKLPLLARQLGREFFGAGAAFVLFSGIVSEFYYINYSRAKESFQPGGTGIGMGTYK